MIPEHLSGLQADAFSYYVWTPPCSFFILFLRIPLHRTSTILSLLVLAF